MIPFFVVCIFTFIALRFAIKAADDVEVGLRYHSMIKANERMKIEDLSNRLKKLEDASGGPK